MLEVTGRLSARFAVRGGATTLSRKYQTYPLKIAKAFPEEDGRLAVCIMDASPGLMAGDRYELIWELEEGAKVALTNQSFTRIHPCGGRPASLRQTIRIGAGAVLDYCPEPVMPYRDAAYLGETFVRMEPGSVLLMSDFLCPGRTQRGERFQYRLFDSRLQVDYGDETVYYTRQRLSPGGASPSGWGEYTHQGSLVVFSDRLSREQLDDLRRCLDGRMGGDILFGASLAYKNGLILTILGRRVWEIQRLIAEAAGIIRSGLQVADSLRLSV